MFYFQFQSTCTSTKRKKAAPIAKSSQAASSSMVDLDSDDDTQELYKDVLRLQKRKLILEIEEMERRKVPVLTCDRGTQTTIDVSTVYDFAGHYIFPTDT